MDSCSFSFDPDMHAVVEPHGNEHPHKNTCNIFKGADFGLTDTDLCLMLSQDSVILSGSFRFCLGTIYCVLRSRY